MCGLNINVMYNNKETNLQILHCLKQQYFNINFYNIQFMLFMFGFNISTIFITFSPIKKFPPSNYKKMTRIPVQSRVWIFHQTCVHFLLSDTFKLAKKHRLNVLMSNLSIGCIPQVNTQCSMA